VGLGGGGGVGLGMGGGMGLGEGGWSIAGCRGGMLLSRLPFDSEKMLWIVTCLLGVFLPFEDFFVITLFNWGGGGPPPPPRPPDPVSLAV
jgi:hypothetical protein